MTLIAGIDPGNSGAVAVYDTDSKALFSVDDLPFWFQSVGAKKRKRIDPIALISTFEMLHMIGVEIIVLEAVGGRPRQSAAAGFVFGYTVGLIYMCCMYSKLMVETVPPQRWKKFLGVPGKKGSSDKDTKKRIEGDIMKRVAELFPHNQDMFRTPKGAYRMDRADAALLAKFGGDYVWPTMSPNALRDDEQWRLAYRNADTGA